MDDYFKKLNEIKKQYLAVEEKILNRPSDICCRVWMVDPYSIKGWMEILTPIENNVWHDLRRIGLPFYPQYPIGKYFVDFADPIKKIVIECDGKKYHQNKEKDKKRQKDIEKIGWEIIRIEGWKTCKDLTELYNKMEDSDGSEEEEDDEIEELRNRLKIETSTGILEELLKCRYSDKVDENVNDEIIELSEFLQTNKT